MDLDGVLDELDAAGVWLDPALTDEEIADVERRFAFTFCADHRALLALALPVGEGWPDWLSDDEEPLRDALAWPVQGILDHVRSGDYWSASWGAPGADRESVARRFLADVPTMVPVRGHRYLPAHPAPPGVPVFSIYASDAIYYGADLADYLAREFLGHSSPVPTPTARIPFWSDLVDDA